MEPLGTAPYGSAIGSCPPIVKRGASLQRGSGIGASRYPGSDPDQRSAAHQRHDRAVDPRQSRLGGTEHSGRHGQRPGRLDDEPGLFGQQPDGRRDLGLVDCDDVVDRALDVGEGPRAFVRAPSAIVRRLRSRGHATSSPPRNDSWASAASSGSTPTIRAFGWSARTAVAIPLMSPPPPTGTSSAPRSSTASAISSPAVPLARDHIVVVVRVDERDAVRFRVCARGSWLVTGPSGSTVITSAPSARTRSSFTAVHRPA